MSAPPPPAFEEVYRTYFRYVWQTLRRLGVRDADAADAAQEVFLVVYRRLPDFEGRAKVANVDVGAAQERAVRLGVLSVPTVIFFKDGKVQETLIGPAQKSVLVSRLQRLL